MLPLPEPTNILGSMIRALRFAAVALVLCTARSVSADPIVDIGLIPGQNNDLEVRMRFSAPFNGFFAASVFTIRWTNASGANLGPIQQDQSVLDYHDMNKSGPEQVDGDGRYQVFAGFGTNVLSDIPYTIPADVWITICTVPILNAPDVFSIVNDPFTAVFNGDFYISLGGQESQGNIVDLNVGSVQPAAPANIFSVAPNPVADEAIINIAQRQPSKVSLTLMDVTGVELWSEELVNTAGTMGEPLGMSRLASGLYFLRMRSPGLERTVRVVKR